MFEPVDVPTKPDSRIWFHAVLLITYSSRLLLHTPTLFRAIRMLMATALESGLVLVTRPPCVTRHSNIFCGLHADLANTVVCSFRFQHTPCSVTEQTAYLGEITRRLENNISSGRIDLSAPGLSVLKIEVRAFAGRGGTDDDRVPEK